MAALRLSLVIAAFASGAGASDCDAGQPPADVCASTGADCLDQDSTANNKKWICLCPEDSSGKNVGREAPTPNVCRDFKPPTLSPETRVPSTPAPDTPAPATPAPTTVPDTPLPPTPAPPTPAPPTPAPETPAPPTPAPPTPAPETPAPPTPLTPVPPTPAPVTSAPDTQTPPTPAPDTPAPPTLAPPTPPTPAPPSQAPDTPAPPTPAPPTPVPPTPSPLTPAPPTPEPLTSVPPTPSPPTPPPVPLPPGIKSLPLCFEVPATDCEGGAGPPCSLTAAARSALIADAKKELGLKNGSSDRVNVGERCEESGNCQTGCGIWLMTSAGQSGRFEECQQQVNLCPRLLARGLIPYGAATDAPQEDDGVSIYLILALGLILCIPIVAAIFYMCRKKRGRDTELELCDMSVGIASMAEIPAAETKSTQYPTYQPISGQLSHQFSHASGSFTFESQNPSELTHRLPAPSVGSFRSSARTRAADRSIAGTRLPQQHASHASMEGTVAFNATVTDTTNLTESTIIPSSPHLTYSPHGSNRHLTAVRQPSRPLEVMVVEQM
eukprot:TRINITY_DN3481_c0_g1_i1.p1 TRINITY_DN3481_c0_g1~~TRINITY_DN3481_c0_g1_i1.p1  ORF type:complete len:568 (+),score=-2.62 TRINITY_DN3481_c0_g1_i1:46-1704(+)